MDCTRDLGDKFINLFGCLAKVRTICYFSWSNKYDVITHATGGSGSVLYIELFFIFYLFNFFGCNSNLKKGKTKGKRKEKRKNQTTG